MMMLLILFSIFVLFLVVFSIDEEVEYQASLREKLDNERK